MKLSGKFPVCGFMVTSLRACAIVSLNLMGEDSARVADALWEEYGICVRAGAHCAPLMHKALGTVEQGVVRFSFSHTNTREEALARCPCGAQPGGGINNA